MRIWFLLASLFLFSQYACYGKKKNQGFSHHEVHGYPHKQNVKRRFYNFRVTIRKKRCVKKNNKCYRGEKENGSMCKNEYGGSTGEWATLSREKRARGEQQWTPFSNSTLSTNREIMYAGNNCRLKANRWIFIRGLGSLRRNNNRNSRTWPSKK